MTLVAAFRCPKGGIMLLADREENDGYNRREVDKIFRTNMPCGQFFIAGSGPSDMTTKAHTEIAAALFEAQGKGKDLAKDHKGIIEDCLRRMHKQYAANLKGSSLDLLIVFAPLNPPDPRYVPILYRTAIAALIPEPVYAAYGTGKPICDYFEARLYEHGRLDKDSMKILGAFILREAEKAAAGVGMGADMQFIHEGDRSVHYLYSGVVKELQDLIPPLGESLWADWEAKIKLPERLLG